MPVWSSGYLSLCCFQTLPLRESVIVFLQKISTALRSDRCGIQQVDSSLVNLRGVESFHLETVRCDSDGEVA